MSIDSLIDRKREACQDEKRAKDRESSSDEVQGRKRGRATLIAVFSDAERIACGTGSL